ncbi:hypothetical protein SUNI508_12422 [Seiridium unicorne]|uniref:RRM domain-containing protein n=1 Tax=Seiridium unicorne TaxID=138068 RepID=A0ABR2UDU4_9PEZI
MDRVQHCGFGSRPRDPNQGQNSQREFMNVPEEYVPIVSNRSFAATGQARGASSAPYDPWNTGANIPEHNSTNLFILGVPQGTTVEQFLAQIRGYGRIYQFHMMSPTGKPGEEDNAVAMAFFELEAIKRFLADAEGNSFYINNQKTRVMMNRRRIPDNSYTQGSRCLIIQGSPDRCNEESLLNYFRTKTRFEIDKVRYRIISARHNKVEIRFAQFYEQADTAMRALARERPDGITRVNYGPDPCAHTNVL